eukprot:1968467-Prymnesium_polylepis.1
MLPTGRARDTVRHRQLSATRARDARLAQWPEVCAVAPPWRGVDTHLGKLSAVIVSLLLDRLAVRMHE